MIEGGDGAEADGTEGGGAGGSGGGGGAEDDGGTGEVLPFPKAFRAACIAKEGS